VTPVNAKKSLFKSSADVFDQELISLDKETESPSGSTYKYKNEGYYYYIIIFNFS